jgi:hypothetical protein
MYPKWVADVVMVKKSNENWRMCMDFTDLNKVCPKDSFPLLKIDKLVDSTVGFEYLTSLDANSGYQVPMHLNDKEKMTFITEKKTFCYQAMPFGLKNTGATY